MIPVPPWVYVICSHYQMNLCGLGKQAYDDDGCVTPPGVNHV